MPNQEAKTALTQAVVDAFGPQVPAAKSAALSDAIAAYVDSAIAAGNAATRNV